MHSFLADEIESEGYQLLFVPLYIPKIQLLHYVSRMEWTFYFVMSKNILASDAEESSKQFGE